MRIMSEDYYLIWQSQCGLINATSENEKKNFFANDISWNCWRNSVKWFSKLFIRGAHTVHKFVLI